MKRPTTAMALGFAAMATVCSTTFGDATLFLIPKGTNPNSHAAGTDVTITRYAGQQITVEVWVQATAAQGVGAFEWEFPCSVTGTSASSLTYMGSPSVGTWDSHPNYIFAAVSDLPAKLENCPVEIRAGSSAFSCVTPGTAKKYLGEAVFETGLEVGTVNLSLVGNTQMNDCGGGAVVLFESDNLIVNVIGRKNADIAPCGGDGIVNLDDILRVLTAFSGDDDCPGVGTRSCCDTSDPMNTASCLDQNIARCVCEVNAFCCNTDWNFTCVPLVESLGCGYCP